MRGTDPIDLEGASTAESLAAPSHTLGRRLKPVALALICAGLLAIAVLVRLQVLKPWVLEGWLMLAVMFPVATHSGVTGLLARLGLMRQLLLMTLIALLLVGHLFLGTRTSFPFVAWRMYAAVQNSDPVVYEYRAILKSGAEVPIVPSRVVSGFTASRFSAELLTKIRLAQRSRNERLSSESERRARTVLSALGRIYNRSHPDDPSKTILVFKKVIPLSRAGANSDQPAQDLLWRVPVE